MVEVADAAAVRLGVAEGAALEAARSVKHVPAAPDSLHWGERHIKVPFKFRSA